MILTVVGNENLNRIGPAGFKYPPNRAPPNWAPTSASVANVGDFIFILKNVPLCVKLVQAENPSKLRIP